MKKLNYSYSADLLTYAWEHGDSDCIHAEKYCRTKPCTVAQGVACCHDCPYNKTCTSKCGKECKL